MGQNELESRRSDDLGRQVGIVFTWLDSGKRQPLSDPYGIARKHIDVRARDADNIYMSDIQQEVRCAICLEDYDSPISLFCGHTFCRECLKKFENLQCPLCRSSVFSTVDDIRENETITALVKHVKNSRNRKNNVLLFEPEEQRLEFQEFHDVERVPLRSLPLFHTCSRKLLLPFMTYKIVIKSKSWQPPKEIKNAVIKQNISYINRSYRHYHAYGRLTDIVRKPNSLSEFECIFEVNSFFEVESEQTMEKGDREMPVCSGRSLNDKTGLGMQHFEPFFKIYDKISQQYKDSILSVVNPSGFSHRENSIVILYSIFALINIGNAEKYSILTTFDDEIRLKKLRKFFSNISIDHAIRNPPAVFNIPVPGYSKTTTVFITIAILFILWKFGFLPSLYGSPPTI